MNSAISVQLALTSGEITSGFIGDAAVVSGSIASGVVGGGPFGSIGSGINTVAQLVFGPQSGALVYQNLLGASGQINSGFIANLVSGVGGQLRTLPGANFGTSLTGAASGVPFASGSLNATSGSYTSGVIPYNIVIGDPTAGASLLRSGDFAQANIFIGISAGNGLSPVLADINFHFGQDNIGIGRQALAFSTSASQNVAIGVQAMVAASNFASENVGIGYNALRNCGGSNNIGIGSNAGGSSFSGNDNVFIGDFADAGDAGAGQSNAVAIGKGALAAESCVTIGPNAGSNNSSLGLTGPNYNLVIIGANAGFSLAPSGGTDSTDNIFIGTNSGNQATAAQRSVFIGSYAGESVTIGNFNTFIGYVAGRYQFEQIAQTAIGFQALQGDITPSNNTGSQNNVVGYQAFANNTSGSANSGLGHQVGLVNTTGSFNTFVGSTAGASNVDGSDNTFIGANTGLANVSGTDNTCVGFNAGTSLNGGQGNVIVGKGAGQSLVAGNQFVFVGLLAGSNWVGVGGNDAQVAIGSQALVGDATTANNTGTQNTAVGGLCLSPCSSGSNNTGLGFQAGLSLVDGGNNLFCGTNSGQQTTSGTDNVFLGYSAGQAAGTTESNLVVIGSQANIIAGSNHSINIGALSIASDQSIVIGYNAGISQTNVASSNILIGYQTGNSLTNGQDNVFMGFATGGTFDTGSNNVAIGAQIAGGSGFAFCTLLGAQLTATSTNDLQLVSGDCGLQRADPAVIAFTGGGQIGVTPGGAIQLTGIPSASEPPVSPAGTARLYFNSDTNKLRYSTNGSSYADWPGF